MRSILRSTACPLSRWSKLRSLEIARRLSVLFLMLVGISACGTAPSTLPGKPYVLPAKPSLAMVACGRPVLLPAWMELADLSTAMGLDAWDKENLKNVNTNSALLDCWGLRHQILIDWINRLPEP